MKKYTPTFVVLAICIVVSIVMLTMQQNTKKITESKFGNYFHTPAPRNERERLLAITYVTHGLNDLSNSIARLQIQVSDQFESISSFTIPTPSDSAEKIRQINLVNTYQENCSKLDQLKSSYDEAIETARTFGFDNEARTEYKYRRFSGGDPF